MNKKVLLFLSLAMPSTLIVGSLAYIANSRVSHLVKGDGVPSIFELDYSDVELIDTDTYQISLKKTTDSEKEVRVNVVGASYHDGKLYSKGAGQDFYFYNVDPIRGIQNCSFSVSQTGSKADLGMVTTLSYNEILLDDALDGKYQDLLYMMNDMEIDGGETFTLDYNSMPFLLDHRHFMVYLVPFGEDFAITDMSCQTACDEEPTPVSIGVNEGTLSSEDKADVATYYHNSLSIDEMGNGMWSWEYDDGSYFLNQCYAKNTTSALEQAIIDSGFTHTLTYDGTYFYQKQVGTTVHTIFASKLEFGFMNYIQTSYASDYPFFTTGATWPSQFIQDNFTHYDMVPPISDPISTAYVDQYQYATMVEDGSRQVIVNAVPKSGVTDSQILSLLASYKDAAIAAGWTVVYEETALFSCVSDDDAELSVQYDEGSVLFYMEEDIIYDVPPTASQIAEDMGWNNSSDVVILNGGSGATYKYGHARYTIFNATSGTLDTFRSALLTAGYALRSEYTNNYYYAKEVDIFGSTLEVNIYVESGEIQVYYYYQNRQQSATKYNDFASLLNSFGQYSSSDVNDIATSLSYLSNYEYYNSNGYGVVLNAGNEFVTQFASVTSITYIDLYGGYKVDSSDYLLFVTLYDGAVRISTQYCYPNNFVTYSEYNSSLDTFISEVGCSVSNCAVYFESGDNLNVSFAGQYSEYYYYGSLSEVNRVKTLYINRLNNNANFAYSDYLDSYMNLTENFGYKISVESYNTDLYYLRIYWRSYTPYQDYQSYNDLDMGDCALFANYPAFISSSDYDEDYFINYYNNTSNANFEIKKGVGFEDNYPDALISAGFNYSDNTYTRYISGRIYSVSIYNYDRTYYVAFVVGDQFYGISTFNSMLSVELISLLSNFEFADYFTSTQNVYHINNLTSSSSIELYTADLSGTTNFISNLTNNLGFSYDSFENVYYKTNANQDDYYCVYYVEHGSYVELKLSHSSYSFLSWVNAVTAMSGYGHNYAKFSDYVVYPDDSLDEIYSITSANAAEVKFALRKSYDISSYISRIQSNSNYTGSGFDEYYFYQGSVRIVERFNVYEVSIRCTVHDGDAPENALPAQLGDNIFSIYLSPTYFAFTPETSGTYRFLSNIAGQDPYAYLYDSNMNILDSNDDGAGDLQFVIEYELEADVTYYLNAYLLSGTEGSTCTVTISKVS